MIESRSHLRSRQFLAGAPTLGVLVRAAATLLERWLEYSDGTGRSQSDGVGVLVDASCRESRKRKTAFATAAVMVGMIEDRLS